MNEKTKLAAVLLLVVGSLLALNAGLFSIQVSPSGVCRWDLKYDFSQADLQDLGCTSTAGSIVVSSQEKIVTPSGKLYVLGTTVQRTISCQGGFIAGIYTASKDVWYFTESGTYYSYQTLSSGSKTIPRAATFVVPSYCLTAPSTPSPQATPPVPTTTWVPTPIINPVVEPTFQPTFVPTYAPTVTPSISAAGLVLPEIPQNPWVLGAIGAILAFGVWYSFLRRR